ncbi:MAG: ribbon-helix-helix protein, CopG family [Clostridiaceae bacterium]|nr:ribbon-helix-helix protein, CopG family [Clostridiaceae bacterium]
MGVERPVYSFRLNKDLVDTLKVLAAQQNRTLSNLVETILLQYVTDYTDND